MLNGQAAISHRPARPSSNNVKHAEFNAQLESLKRQINLIRVENCYMQYFVPEDKLKEIISEDVINSLNRGIDHAYRRNEITRYILDRAVKVFAVLIAISRPARMQDFMTHDQSNAYNLDHQRPFTLHDLQTIFGDDLVASEFFDKQWEFWPPRFSGEVIRREFLPKTIFPFVRERHLATGGYGDVFRVHIHPLYRPLHFQHVEVFVRKELSLKDTTFEIEAHTLSVLQELRHPCILPLISCYTYRSKHHLISPYKEDGNLKQLLAKDRAANLTREELLFSIAGISSALWALHECVLDDSEPMLKGLHQDLNPDNILVDGRRFILADFGLSSIKDLSANSRTPFKGRRGYYQAPECVDLVSPFDEHDATRASDVWAMGCMMADLLVHFVKGPSGVEDFRKAREFDIHRMGYSGLFHKGQSENEAVELWLKTTNREDGSRAMQDLTQLVLSMLQIVPDLRPKASEVTAELCRIAVEAFGDSLKLLFQGLPPSCELLVEKSRLMAWLSCQSTDFYLSMPGATKSNQTFESAIDLLRQFAKELEILSQSEVPLDSRALWQLRSLNTQLSSMLPPDRKRSSQSRFETYLFEEAKLVGLSLEYPDVERALGNPRINELALTRALVAQAETDTEPSGQLTFREMSHSDFKSTKRNHVKVAILRPTADAPSQTLLLESVPYQDSSTGRRLRSRFIALCTLLSRRTKDVRTPTLFALCNNQEALRYELLYEFPKTGSLESSQVNPVTLYSLLTEKDRLNFPSLDRRLSLALKLSEAVAAFHDLEWFHKDLTSKNILFFPHMSVPATARSSDPYLCGFGNSRKESDDFTQGPLHDRSHHRYHFPGYISVADRSFTRFVRQYDWYSLGVVLLEIGFWQPLDIIMTGYEAEDNSAFARHLREEKLHSLSFYLGDAFVDVIRFCLDLPRQNLIDSGGDTQPNAVFKKMVVEQLRALAFRFSEPPMSKKRKANLDDDGPQIRTVRQRFE